MICPWCGMDSATTDQCSWCHRSFSPNNEEESVETAIPEAVSASPSAEPEQQETGIHVEEPAAPWAISPPLPAAETAAPANGDVATDQSAHLPIIGVRRTGIRRKPAGSAPIPGVAPTMKPAPGIAPPRQNVPAPATPPARRTLAPLNGTATIAPDTASAQAAASSGQVTPSASPLPRPVVRPGVVPKPVTPSQSAKEQSAGEEEPQGLAAGQSASHQQPANIPQMGTFTAAKSKYYSGQVIDPVSGTHYDSDTGKAVAEPLSAASAIPTEAERQRRVDARKQEIHIQWQETKGEQNAALFRYLGVFAIILVVTGVLAAAMHSIYLAPLCVAQFAAALLLPVMRVAPWADEDNDDAALLFVGIFIGGLILTCGPAVALIAYSVFGLMKRDANPAVVGCLIIATLTRLTVEFATGGFSMALFAPFNGQPNWVSIALANWSALLTAFGWYAASVFHKAHE